MAVSASKHEHTANQMLKPAVLAGMKDSVDLKEGMVVVAVVVGGGARRAPRSTAPTVISRTVGWGALSCTPE